MSILKHFQDKKQQRIAIRSQQCLELLDKVNSSFHQMDSFLNSFNEFLDLQQGEKINSDIALFIYSLKFINLDKLKRDSSYKVLRFNIDMLVAKHAGFMNAVRNRNTTLAKQKLDAEYEKRQEQIEHLRRLEEEKKRQEQIEQQRRLEEEKKRQEQIEHQRRLEEEKKRQEQIEHQRRLEEEKKRQEQIEHKRQFEERRRRYEHHEKDSEALLAWCYLNGIGVNKDESKAYSLLVEGAFNDSLASINKLAEFYSSGVIVDRNEYLARYINSLGQNNRLPSYLQYKAMEPTKFRPNLNNRESILLFEREVLENYISNIAMDIKRIKSTIAEISYSTWWMDSDQRHEWVFENKQNEEKVEKANKLGLLMGRPYFARMDAAVANKKESHYIGESDYRSQIDPSVSIVSIWSEYGKKYRQNNINSFNINDFEYLVALRRRFDITEGKLENYYDLFNVDSEASINQITDPFLIKILEEKKGESRVTNIIRSIQLNQNDIIEHDFNSNIIVQGCAGSGKTMILLHRLANIKYNNPNRDMSKIKIITPNIHFKLFIDELSKNLGIDQIEKVTLNEFYITILMKYRERNRKQKKDDYGILSMELTGTSAAQETALSESDLFLGSSIVSIIYSDSFKSRVVRLSKERFCTNKIKDYGALMQFFKEDFNKLTSEYGIDRKINKNYTCVLYIKLLYCFSYYGPLIQADMPSMICIDEGQDISIKHYELIDNINRGNTVMNIYGDLEQRIAPDSSISSWDELADIISCKIFTLNENYRNSDTIVKFYNSRLGYRNLSFGLETKPVRKIKFSDLLTEVKFQLFLMNRTAVIINNPEILPPEIIDICSDKVLDSRKAILLTVMQAKGLEFDTVFVFDNNMNKNERYISYTRALSELYIVV